MDLAAGYTTRSYAIVLTNTLKLSSNKSSTLHFATYEMAFTISVYSLHRTDGSIGFLVKRNVETIFRIDNSI